MNRQAKQMTVLVVGDDGDDDAVDAKIARPQRQRLAKWRAKTKGTKSPAFPMA